MTCNIQSTRVGRSIAIIALTVSYSLAAYSLPAIAADEVRVIQVNGSGESRAAPDVAYLTVEIETHAPTAEQASAKNAELAQKVMQELKKRVADKGTVETGNYNLMPEYSQPLPISPNRPMPQKPSIIGYTAQNSISIESRDLTILGALIDSAIAAGANRVNQLSFDLKNNALARQQAIEKAARDAQGQAQALASALGVKLKRVIKASTIPEQEPVEPRPFRVRAMGMAAAVATNVQPSEVTVTATVSLTYEIE